jgi:hypothetical protein
MPLQAAGAKIKDQLNVTLISKMRQPPSSEFTRDKQKIKWMSSLETVEELERPRKSRRLEQEQPTLPPDEQHENTSINKTQEIKNLETNNRTKEEEMINSPDLVTSSVYDDCLSVQEEKGNLFTDNALVAYAKGQTCDNLPGIPDEAPVQIRPSISVCVPCAREVDLVDSGDSVACDEPHTNETRILSHPDTIDITEDNKTAQQNVIVSTEEGTEPSLSGTENFGDEVHQSAIERNMSDEEELVIEVGKTAPNVMSTEASQNNICAKVVDENVSKDVTPKQWVTCDSPPALPSSPKKKAVGEQKSTHLLRYVAAVADLLNSEPSVWFHINTLRPVPFKI